MCFFKKPEATHMGPAGKAGSCRAGTERTASRRCISKSPIACQTEAWQHLGGAADSEVYQRHRSWGQGVRAAPTRDGRRSGPEERKGLPCPSPLPSHLRRETRRGRGAGRRGAPRGEHPAPLGRLGIRHLGSAGTRPHQESLPLRPLLPRAHQPTLSAFMSQALQGLFTTAQSPGQPDPHDLLTSPSPLQRHRPACAFSTGEAAARPASSAGRFPCPQSGVGPRSPAPKACPVACTKARPPAFPPSRPSTPGRVRFLSIAFLIH